MVRVRVSRAVGSGMSCHIAVMHGLLLLQVAMSSTLSASCVDVRVLAFISDVETV